MSKNNVNPTTTGAGRDRQGETFAGPPKQKRGTFSRQLRTIGAGLRSAGGERRIATNNTDAPGNHARQLRRPSGNEPVKPAARSDGEARAAKRTRSERPPNDLESAAKSKRHAPTGQEYRDEESAKSASGRRRLPSEGAAKAADPRARVQYSQSRRRSRASEERQVGAGDARRGRLRRNSSGGSRCGFQRRAGLSERFEVGLTRVGRRRSEKGVAGEPGSHVDDTVTRRETLHLDRLAGAERDYHRRWRDRRRNGRTEWYIFPQFDGLGVSLRRSVLDQSARRLKLIAHPLGPGWLRGRGAIAIISSASEFRSGRHEAAVCRRSLLPCRCGLLFDGA